MELKFTIMVDVGKEVKWLRNMILDIKLWPQSMSVIFYTTIVKQLCLELTVIFTMVSQDI
jgi:hypothetical protein